MDNLQEFIHTHLPPDLLSTLTTHSSTYYRILSTLLTIRSTFSSIVNPILTRLLHSPDIPTVLLLLLVLFVSFKILDLLYRSIMFWVRIAVRLAFWVVVVGAGLWLYQRGLGGVSDDVGYWAGQWKQEYNSHKTRSEMARLQQQLGMGMRGRGRW